MATFGDTLKRERELREISLREISDATKINIRYLEALEQNRFDALPGGLFNKGFIRAYSTYIGVDGEAMVNCYLQEIAGREQGAAEGGGPQGMHRPAEAPRRRSGSAADPEGGNGHPLAISFAASAKSDRTTPPASAGPAGSRPASGPVAAPDAWPAPLLRSPGAVTHIEETETAEGPSRVLPFILAIVGGAGALFLTLSVTLKHPAPRSRSASPSFEVPAAPPAPIGGTEPLDQRSALASAGGGRAAAPPGHTTPAAGEVAPPSAPARVQAPPPVRSGAAVPAASPMELQIETTGTTWVQLFCDDREAINWVMKEGESESMRCLRTIRVSAADASAVRLTIGGALCAPLGEAGSRVHGFTIRVEDARQICPPSGRGNDGRS